jgi:hypothetical protein
LALAVNSLFYFLASMSKRKSVEGPANGGWEDVEGASSDKGVAACLKEVVNFWSHGAIDAAEQVVSAKVRTRGSRKTKANTDYQIRILCDLVVSGLMHSANISFKASKSASAKAVLCF